MIRYLDGVEVGADERVIRADALSARYGLGLFETILVDGSRIRNGRLHFERLARFSRDFGLPSPDIDLILDDIDRIIASINEAFVRIRVVVGAGSTANATFRIVEGSSFDEQALPAVTLAIDDTIVRAPRVGGRCKGLSYIDEYTVTARAQLLGAFDGLMLASDGSFAEGGRTSLFVRTGRTILTPSLDLGIVDGVMRRRVLGLLGGGDGEWSTEVGIISIHDIEDADEVFVTNALRGVVSVGTIVDARGDRISSHDVGATSRWLGDAIIQPSRDFDLWL